MGSDLFTVRHNVTAMFAHRQSTLNNGTLNQALERLSSGYRINRAADDVAGLAVSEKMRTQIRGFHQAARNIQDGISFIQTADAALQDVHDIMQRTRELLVQSANGTYTDSDRTLIQLEIDALMEEIDRIHTSTYFAKTRVFEYRAADIVWIVDGTGSMAPEQAAVAAAASTFVSELNNRNIDYRLGVVKYGHLGGDGELPAAQGGWTTDSTTFANNVTAVGTGGGIEEDGMEAFNSSVTTFSYRPEARKIFIMLTDEDSDDGIQGSQGVPNHPDITATTRDNMVANKVIAFVVGTAGTGAETEPSYNGAQSIPTATGGAFYNTLAGTFADDVAQGIKDVIGEQLKFHVGPNKNQTFESALQHPVDTASMGIANRISASTQGAAESSLALIDSAISQITRIRSFVGAEVNRLEYSLDYSRVVGEKMQSAESRIRDADMASEMIDFTKSQVIVQAANAMLAQANLLPQNVLALLG